MQILEIEAGPVHYFLKWNEGSMSTGLNSELQRLMLVCRRMQARRQLIEQAMRCVVYEYEWNSVYYYLFTFCNMPHK